MILVADNINISNPVVAEAMQGLDKNPIQDLTRRCEANGAAMIDINPGYLSKNKEDRMEFLVESVQEATSLRLVLDSPNPRLLARGMASCDRKPVLNALTMEKYKLDEILPLAVEYDTDLVILLLDERSYTPPGMDEKLALAVRLRELSIAAGVSQDKIIFDPVLPNLGWDDAFSQAAEVVKSVRLLAGGMIFQDPARTIVGLSNLRSRMCRRYPPIIEDTCAAMLAGAGLEMLLANALNRRLLDLLETIDKFS